MTHLASIKALIDQWPARKDLASEVGVSLHAVHKWAQSGSIPARFHGRVLASAKARGIAVSADDLVRLHDVPDAEDAA